MTEHREEKAIRLDIAQVGYRYAFIYQGAREALFPQRFVCTGSHMNRNRRSIREYRLATLARDDVLIKFLVKFIGVICNGLIASLAGVA